MLSSLRARREAARLSQADLAASAGVSRSQIAAIEAGRHAPSVRTGLALAARLGTTVEELFGSPPARAEPVLEALPQGAPVRVARVGPRLVYAPLEPGAELVEGADARLGAGGRPELYPGVEPAGFVVAGCEPSLGLMAHLLAARGAERLIWVHATSGRAQRALGEGRIHAAVVHGPVSELRGEPPGLRRIEIARWNVGLAFARELRLSAEELASGRGRIAQRERDAAAQRALRRATRATPPGPRAAGHLQTVQLVELGLAEAALTIEPVARAWGLDFVPLELHRVELRLPEASLREPGGRALVDLLHSSAYLRRLVGSEGYDLTGTGDELH